MNLSGIRGAFAVLCAALVPTLALVRCSSSGPPAEERQVPADQATKIDGGDAPGWFDAAAGWDGNVDSAVDACAAHVVSSGCGHPSVDAGCDGGWCFIPHGCFVMGSPPCEFRRGLYTEDENETTLTHDFWMKETEVTQAEWIAEGLANRAGGYDSGEHDCIGPTCPASNMTWYEALAYANRLSTKAGLEECYQLVGCTGALGEGMACADAGNTTASLYECRGYRIPTEAEWEYAARAGTRTAFYGGDITPTTYGTNCRADPALEGIAWYCANTDASTMPVGSKRPNGWGVHDLAGNAFERVTDLFQPVAYGNVPRTDPGARLEPGPLSALRGGVAWGWSSLERSADRLQSPRWLGGPGVGLRLVRRAD